ncbi:hypothetical protein FJTKL_05968 [Diaporthe vaccinii]|uniref:Uncharacterized protein n=1 Tax=Diaporthe vaccinii TaxID=105482 RepID=A0ABR4DR56_9PEZI
MATRIRNVPVVFEWADTSSTSTPRSFLHLAGPDDLSLQLNLYFDEQEQTGILKIRVLLDRKGPPHQGRDYLYLWIHPKDVILMLQDPVHRLHDGVSTVLRGPTTCLRLVLSKPASMVAPSDCSLPLREGPGPQMLDSLILLTKQTIFTIHMDQHIIPAPEKIQQLCYAFCNGSIEQHPRHNTLRDFYKGRDAVIIKDLACFAGLNVKSTGLTADGPSNARDAETPPPYADGQPPPPSLFAQQPPNKRQRVTANVSTTISSDIGGVYTELLAQQKAYMDAFLSSQQAQMEKILASMSAQVDKMADKVIKQVDKRIIEESATIWDKKPSQWEWMIQNGIQREVEDALPKELEDFRDTLRQECINDLKDDLEGGLVSITIPR